MLFNSYGFLFLFLPLVWVIFKLTPTKFRLRFLIVVSLVFYGVFSWEYLLLLLVSIGFNYSVAIFLTKNTISKPTIYRKLLLGTAILLNLMPLVYFKYTLTIDSHMLFPLALSFYTFQQIAFLVDIYQKKVQIEGIEKYLFFVLFFPQLIAGPIVHYQQILSQVHSGGLKKSSITMLEAGVVLFFMGLFKKVAIADTFFMLSDRSFSIISSSGVGSLGLDGLSLYEAWSGLLGYSFGIYFDFSAYSDMAIGLALLFGIRLPMNFNSPYKATSLVDFWRRWHITLSEFLKQYLYIPMGGNRHGRGREVASLVATMTLAGIWHGTGWTFLLWGFVHGVLLVLVHLYQHYFKQWTMPQPLAVFLTFLAVTLLWVLFKASSLEEALQYYAVLFGAGVIGTFDMIEVLSLALGFVIVWFLPNSMQNIGYPKVKKMHYSYAIFTAMFTLIALKLMADAPAKSFVYFNF